MMQVVSCSPARNVLIMRLYDVLYAERRERSIPAPHADLPGQIKNMEDNKQIKIMLSERKHSFLIKLL